MGTEEPEDCCIKYSFFNSMPVFPKTVKSMKYFIYLLISGVSSGVLKRLPRSSPITVTFVGLTFHIQSVRGVCNFLGSVSPQQKFETTDESVLQFSFIGKQRKIHPPGVRAGQPKRREEKRGSSPCRLPPFIHLSPPPPTPILPYVNWAIQKGCLFYLRSSLQSLDLPSFYFLRPFPSLSFSHRHFGLHFPILST